VQLAPIKERRIVLLHRINTFRTNQQAFMPQVSQLVAQTSTSYDLPETIPLHLPSDLPPLLRSTTAMDKLIDIEAQLRYAQASDALSELRQSLCVRAHLSNYTQGAKAIFPGW
jgi:hypothetical protein